jgi:hypothetical protein
MLSISGDRYLVDVLFIENETARNNKNKREHLYIYLVIKVKGFPWFHMSDRE